MNFATFIRDTTARMVADGITDARSDVHQCSVRPQSRRGQMQGYNVVMHHFDGSQTTVTDDMVEVYC